MSKYIFYWVKKKRLVLGVFRYRRRYVANDNGNRIEKKGGGNRNVNLQMLSIYANARSLFAYKILTHSAKSGDSLPIPDDIKNPCPPQHLRASSMLACAVTVAVAFKPLNVACSSGKSSAAAVSPSSKRSCIPLMYCKK